MAVAHPPILEPELSNGKTVKLRPWVMAQRAELRPRIGELLAALSKLEGGLKGLAGAPLKELFMSAENEISGIVRASISLAQMSDEEWGQMPWEDLPVLAQAVWELNVARPDGGGVLAKLAAALGMILGSALEAAAREARAGNGKSPPPIPMDPNKTSSSHEASAFLPVDGVPIPSA